MRAFLRPLLPSQPRQGISPALNNTIQHSVSLKSYTPGSIPYDSNLESGLLRQSKKRKANSEASRLLRQKKQNKELHADIDRLGKEILTLRK